MLSISAFSKRMDKMHTLDCMVIADLIDRTP